MPEGREAASWPRRWGGGLLKAALTLAVTALILRVAGVGIVESARSVDFSALSLEPAFLVLSVALLLPAFVLQAWLWSGIVRDLGDRRPRLAVATGIVLVANLGRYVPFKLAQIAGLAMLARRAGLSAARAGTAAVTGQVVHLLAAVVVGGWAAYGSPDFPKGRALVVAAALLVALACAVGFGWIESLLEWALRRSGRSGAEISRPTRRRLLQWLGGYLIGWAVYGAAFYCLIRGAGFDAPPVVAAASFAGAYLVGYIAVFAPAGIGVREAALVSVLDPVLGLEASLAVALLQRVWITAAELVGAACGALVIRKPDPQEP